jgi:hypothetical protein
MHVIEYINRFGNVVFGGWFELLAPLPLWAQVLVTALPVTVFALLVFRYASDQQGIAAVKDQVKAHLLELWLYRDYPSVLLRAQGQIIVNSFAYLGYALLPMAVMLMPLVLLLVQAEARYALRPLLPGDTVIVTADLAGEGPRPAASLDVPPGLVAETPALYTTGPARLHWRLRAVSGGEHLLGITVNAPTFTAEAGDMRTAADVPGAGDDRPGQTSDAPRADAGPATAQVDSAAARRIVVGAAGAALAATSYGATDWRALGSPVETLLEPGGPLRAITVGYADRGGTWLGLSAASWGLLAATLVLGFVLRGWFRVTF